MQYLENYIEYNVLYVIFQVLHSVAKNALFKRAIMEQEYEFDILEDDVK